MHRLPKKIQKEPLIDATVEIRFESLIDRSAVFGVIYYALRELYTKVEQLPIMQLPLDAIESDPLTASQARYRIYSEKFNLQIGPSSVSVHCNNNYLGWAEYSQEIFRVIQIINELKIVKNVNRVGVRYVNFLHYSLDIFRDLQLKLSFPQRNLDKLPTTIRVLLPELPDNKYFTQLSIANYTEAIRDNEKMVGSVIDIDTIRTVDLENFFSGYKQIIDQAHDIEKSLFFGLFTEEYLESLEPLYNES